MQQHRGHRSAAGMNTVLPNSISTFGVWKMMTVSAVCLSECLSVCLSLRSRSLQFLCSTHAPVLYLMCSSTCLCYNLKRYLACCCFVLLCICLINDAVVLDLTAVCVCVAAFPSCVLLSVFVSVPETLPLMMHREACIISGWIQKSIVVISCLILWTYAGPVAQWADRASNPSSWQVKKFFCTCLFSFQNWL